MSLQIYSKLAGRDTSDSSIYLQCLRYHLAWLQQWLHLPFSSL